MSLPNVNIKLGNGKLGRSSATSDGVAGLVLTGAAVAGKLELNKHYLLSSTRDLTTLGITTENNPLADKEVKAFYTQAGEGAELHLLIVPAATTLTAMCAAEAESPLSKLIDAAGGRVRLVGVNKIAPAEYEAELTQGIDADAITAAAAAQQQAESYAERVQPFRLLMPACGWNGTTEKLFKPAEASYNAVAFVLASDDRTTKTASIGMFLGRLASIEAQQSLARVKSGSIAADGYFTDGAHYLEHASLGETLNDAGYLFFIKYPTKNGCYVNGDHTAASDADDYSRLYDGRIIDKARVIVYDTYISEIKDNVVVDDDGNIPQGACRNFEGLIENAIGAQMGTQISGFQAVVDPQQNVLSTGKVNIKCQIIPQGVLDAIDVDLSFDNPALKQ